jgi:division protein CdvB (Snf7/Vps24/ESCRT-III family)
MVAYYDGGGGARDPVVPRVDTFESAIEKLGCIAEELGSLVQSSAEAVAKRLLSESMDRLAIVARDVSDLAAETAIDLALIETKRIQIDRAQAENWALLRELTEQAQ